MKTPLDWTSLLQKILEEFDCVTGTLHQIHPDQPDHLSLLAAIGLPPHLLPVVQTIPIGKGIAGAAAQSLEPVQLCNLQTDNSGVARPEAKSTQVQGSLAVPILSEGQLLGVIGIGKTIPYEFSDEEQRALTSRALALVPDLKDQA